MSSNPSLVSSFRYVTAIPPGAVHDTVVQALRIHDNAITDLETAIPLLKTQIDSLKSSGSGSSSSSTTTVITQENIGVMSFNNETGNVAFFPFLGFVNNQSGVTAYTTQQSDNGAIIILNDSSSITIDLNAVIQINWYTWIANYGSGDATLTPSSGTITYPANIGASSMPLASGFAAMVNFDGANFWAVAVPIQGGGGTITGVTAGTGLTGGGSSGNVTLALITPVSVVDGGTGTATPSLVAGSGISITGSWPDQTVSATGGSGILRGTVTVAASGTSGTFTGTGTVTGATTSMTAFASAPALIQFCGTNPVSWVCDVQGTNTVEVQVTLPNIGPTWANITFQVAVIA